MRPPLAVFSSFAASASFAVVLAAVPLLTEGVAHAADPTTADCLGSSDAALRAGNEHKLRAERAQLLVCAAASCPADIRKECIARVDEVNAQIPTIIFAAKAGGADLSAVKISMDGEILVERLEGTPLSIDPGEHTFTFETAGQSPVTKKILVAQAQKDRRELVVFGAGASDASSTSATPGALPTTSERGGGLGTQKTLALVAGGVGVVGLGVGAAFGLIAMSKKSDAQSACPNQCASQDGVDKWTSAGAAGTVSTIGFVVGAVAVAGAAALWLTAPNAPASTRVGLGPGGVQVRGTW